MLDIDRTEDAYAWFFKWFRGDARSSLWLDAGSSACSRITASRDNTYRALDSSFVLFFSEAPLDNFKSVLRISSASYFIISNTQDVRV